MSPRAAIRWSGPAAILGGVLGILLTPVLTFAGWMEAPGGVVTPPMAWARTVANLATNPATHRGNRAGRNPLVNERPSNFEEGPFRPVGSVAS